MKDVRIMFKDLKGFNYFRDMINKYLQDALPNDSFLFEVAVNEAVNNSLKYGTHSKQFVSLDMRISKFGRVVIRIKDQGPGFCGNQKLKALKVDCESNCENNLFKSSGRGLAIMVHASDSITFNKRGNEIILVKKAVENDSEINYYKDEEKPLNLQWNELLQMQNG